MSHRELFDYAITFLHWGIKERQKNRIIASLDEREKNYKEVVMPIFTWVVPAAAVQPEIAVTASVAESPSAGAVAGHAATATPAAEKASGASAGKIG
jgi:hypothetical protein